MERQPLKVGLIGTGGIAWKHARGIRAEQDELALAAACDVRAEALEALADEFDVPQRYASYRDLLAQGDIEAVVVLAPHDLHEEICTAALRAGKHVLVEKPIARRLDEADRMIREADLAERILMVGFNQRYMPIHRRIAWLVGEGVIGEVFAARTDHHQDFARPAGHWWRSREAVGGGCVIGSGIHRLDLLRWYLGEPREVFACHGGDASRLEAEVVVAASIRFAGGAVGDFFCNWGVPYARVSPSERVLGESMTLFGREGVIHTGPREAVLIRRAVTGDHWEQEPITALPREYESMWKHFARCVRTGDVPETNGPDGRKSLEFVIGIYRSMETGEPVTFPLA